jgi:hypothetical protein
MPSNSIHCEADDRADVAIAMMSPLPYAAATLPGIGGIIKATPEHFVVEEVLPYAACGEGEHVYVTFRRTGWNTADAARSMQKRWAWRRRMWDGAAVRIKRRWSCKPSLFAAASTTPCQKLRTP